MKTKFQDKEWSILLEGYPSECIHEEPRRLDLKRTEYRLKELIY
jgi:hypothetical protein